MPGATHGMVRRLSRRIRRAFKADRAKRAKEAGDAIEDAFASYDWKRAYGLLMAWYRQAGGRPSRPSRADLRKVTEAYTTLYTRAESLPGESIPIHVAPFEIDDSVATEAEIASAVKRLRNDKAPGPSGLRAEHLKGWLSRAYPDSDDDGDPTYWEPVVALVQHMFASGQLPTKLTWSTVILLPKGGGAYRGIGLCEIIWKVASSIINTRLRAITFHDTLHGFRAERGTGTAIIEAKLHQQLASVEQVPVFQVYLDLRKAYDTLDRGRTLEILEGYGVGPKVRRLLVSYWDAQQFVVRQNDYFGDPLRPTRGVTQGDIVSPTVFNIVVDAIVRHWLALTVDDGSETNGRGVSVRELLVLFYADDGLIASRNPEWLEWALNELSRLFESVGLKTNLEKTKAMNCFPACIAGPISDQAYSRRLRGGGLSHGDRRRRRVECPECGKSMKASSLLGHRRNVHGLATDSSAADDMIAGYHDSQHYRQSFPKYLDSVACPVEGCAGSAKTPFALRKHFAYRHPHATLVIPEEGSAPHPQCERCGMHVPVQRLNRGHQQTQMCRQMSEVRAQRRAREASRKAREVVLSLQGTPLEGVSTFRYLGRILSSTDDDWPAVHRNISRARQRWARVNRVLARTGGDPGISGKFYKAVVQSVLLYGCETWDLTRAQLGALERFHNRAARRLSGRTPRRSRRGAWVWPSPEEALTAARLRPVSEYISVRRSRFVDKIATRPIVQLCQQVPRQRGSSRRSLWWDPPSED